MKLARRPPHKEINERMRSKGTFGIIAFGATRINPYPPSFKRIPAKIIEPATGA